MAAAVKAHVQQLVTQLRPVAEALDRMGIPWAALPFAVGLPLLRLMLDRTLFQAVWIAATTKQGRRSIQEQSELHAEKESLQQHVNKFKESFWKMLCYGSLFAGGFYIVVSGGFLFNTLKFWEGCTSIPCSPPEPLLGIWVLYSLEMGHYLQAIPSLIWWETRRKDVAEQFGHHICTLALIVYSYKLNFIRVGCAVFMLHDFNDLFLEAAKMARYTEHHTVSRTFFVVFMVTWFITRLYYFPAYVLNSTLLECLKVSSDALISVTCVWLCFIMFLNCNTSTPFKSLKVAQSVNVDPMPHYAIINTLLFFLLGLHIYWSYLIVRVAIRDVREGSLDDVREDLPEEAVLKKTK